MGLFGFGKKKGTSNRLVDWLYKVDQAYAYACQVKNASGLQDYLTRGCLAKQMERIRLGEKLYAGLDRYKHVEWRALSSQDNLIKYRKTVTYDNIKFSRGITAAVGEGYEEDWTVTIVDNKYYVSDIRRLAYG